MAILEREVPLRARRRVRTRARADVDELVERLQEVVQDFAQRPTDPGGVRVGLITMLHHLDARDGDEGER